MSRNETVDNGIWSDPDFADLTPNGKLMYLWSFTNPACGMAGLYKIGPKRISWETGIAEEAVSTVLAELGDAGLLVYEDHVLWVRARVRHIKSRTQQIARSIAKDVEKLAPEHPQRTRFLAAYERTPWLREQLAILNDPATITSTFIRPAVKQAVLERDAYRCVDCGSSNDLTMGHVTPRSHGGLPTVENLATRCQSCNSKKGVRPNRNGRSSEPQDPLEVQEGQHLQQTQEPHEVPESRSETESSSSTASVPPRATGRVDQLIPPRELAAEHPAVAARLDEVLGILVAVHDERGGNLPTPRGIGLAMLRHPQRDHVAVAWDLQHWALAGRGQNQVVKDWARTYATFLERAPLATPTRGVVRPQAVPANGRRDPDAERRERTARRLGHLMQPTADMEGSAVDAA